MFRLTKKRGRRHKSADSLLLTAPVEQQRKETFSLALPGKSPTSKVCERLAPTFVVCACPFVTHADLRDKDALVDVFLK